MVGMSVGFNCRVRGSTSFREHAWWDGGTYQAPSLMNASQFSRLQTRGRRLIYLAEVRLQRRLRSGSSH